MMVNILVATPHTAFGELLRLSLEDSGQYHVRLVQSSREASNSTRHTLFHLAILDAALGDEPFVPFCMELIQQQPGLRLVVIPPDNNPNHPALGGLIPHGYLSRPFYLPDLIDTVSRLVADREKQLQIQSPAGLQSVPPAAASNTLPPWLQEQLTLHSSLEEELAKTQAITAIAGFYGPDSDQESDQKGIIRSSAGRLSEKAAQELAEIVFRYWNRAEKTDLMRFVRLAADKNDYLIYATQITGDLILIMVYDTSAPLSQIRPQTKFMAQSLANVPRKEISTDGAAPADAPAPVGTFTPAEISAPAETSETDVTSGSAGASMVSDVPAIAGTPAPEDNPSLSGQDILPYEDIPDENEPEPQPLDDDLFFSRVSAGFAPISNTPADADAHRRDERLINDKSSANKLSDNKFSDNLPSAENLAAEEGFAPADVPPAALPDEPVEEERIEDDHLDPGVMNLSALLGTVPAPNPESKPPADFGWFTEASADSPITTSPGEFDEGAPLEVWELPEEYNLDSQVRSQPVETTTEPLPGPTEDPSLPPGGGSPFSDTTSAIRPAGTRPSAGSDVKTEPPISPIGIPAPIEPRAASQPPNLFMGNESAPTSLEDTHPHVISTINNLNQLEHASPALSLLNYTCVLVPRLPQHYLTGELADRMGIWVQQLCLAFGWRLEGLSIRPEYLQWTVQVPPSISPGNLVRIIRQRTSMHIFGNYPHLADQNPSGDFWAAGYLIVSGAQPPSAQLLRDYIIQTRKRQGANK